MKKIFNYLFTPAAAMAAMLAVSCDPSVEEETPVAPTIEIGDVSVNLETKAATVIITPSGNAESVYWAYAESESGTPENFTKESIPAEGRVTVTTPSLSSGTYKIYAYAENAAGVSETAVSEEFTVGLNVADGELVAFNVVNVTAFSLDVEVKMAENCARYCVTAFMNGSYDEKRFIESSKTSIKPNESYPRQPYNVFTEDALVPESLLAKGRLSSDEGSDGIALSRGSSSEAGGELTLTEYQVAIYAEDNDGNYKVYTSEEFTLPEPDFGSAPVVKITPDEITMRSISTTFEAEGDCAKIARGYCLPTENNIIDWENASEEQIVNVLKDLAMTNPPYQWNGTAFTEDVPKDLSPGIDVYVYAIGITADGQLGKLCYKKITSATPVVDGEGTVNVKFVNEEPFGTLNFKVTLDNNATSARLMVCDEINYAQVAGNLEWVFTDEEQNYRWTEVTAEQLAETDGIVGMPALYPGAIYYVHAVAITPDGKVSPVADFDEVTSMAAAPVETIDYSLGTGEATITEKSSTTYYYPADGNRDIDYTYTVTKGANTEKVYVFPIADVRDNDEAVEDFIMTSHATTADYEDADEFTEFGVELDGYAMALYDDYYGGYGYAVITVDANGNYAIADYYIAKGDPESMLERPDETEDPDEPGNIDFSLGIGEASIEVNETTYAESDGTFSVDITYTISKGANTAKVFLVRGTCENNDQSVKELVDGWNFTSEADMSALEFTDFGTEKSQGYFPTYWNGNSALVIVTLDTEGNFAIADYHVVMGDEQNAIPRS